MSKFAIVFPDEIFETEEAAIIFASEMLIGIAVESGVYVVPVDTKTHLKVVDGVMQVWE